MIIKVPKSGITEYELKYFFEADTSNRRNIRKITLGDSGKASVNGIENNADDDIGLDTDDIPADYDQEEIPDEDTGNDNDIAIDTDDDIDILTDGDQDMGGDDDIAIDGDEDDIDSEEDPESNNSGGDAPATDNDEASEGNSDVAIDDSDDEGTNVDGDTSGDTDTEADTQSSEKDTKELIQKNALFQDFKNMHEALGKYIEKINMLIAYNTDSTAEYQVVCDNFDELRNYIYEYMLVKFSSAKYVESVWFYQTALASLYLILDDLNKIKVKNKATARDTRKHNSNPKDSVNK